MKTWYPPSPWSRPVLRRLALSAGFTLIEVLVVMSLLSLVMLAMGSALRTTAQTEERVDQRLQRTDEMRVADGFLRSILGRVAARKVPLPLEPGASQFIFSGQARQITWVGVMPARYGVGGRHHFRLQVQGAATGTQTLLLQYTAWLDDALPPDWSQAASHALVQKVTSLDLQYEDALPEPPVWTSQWTVADRLPQRVLLSLETEAGPWPAIVVTMRLLPGSDPDAGGRAVFGGSQ